MYGGWNDSLDRGSNRVYVGRDTDIFSYMENAIIKPAHNKPAMMCKSWQFIKCEAEQLRELMKRGEFEGKYKSAYAISHAQVSHAPLHFFVINEELEEGKLMKYFGHWCVFNFKILETDDPVYWPEACMSFPHRDPKNTDRWNKIKVEYRIPFLRWSRKITRRFRGLPAFLVQHELEHALGKNLYGK